jgi:hypothetical protein
MFTNDPFLEQTIITRQQYGHVSFVRAFPIVDRWGEYCGPVVCHVHRFFPSISLNHLTANNPNWNPVQTDIIWNTLERAIRTRVKIHRTNWQKMVTRRETKRERIRTILASVLLHINIKTKFKEHLRRAEWMSFESHPRISKEQLPSFSNINTGFSVLKNCFKGPVVKFTSKIASKLFKQMI